MRWQMKIPRLMRIFKLVKLVRVLKASSVIQRWQIYTVLWLNNKAYTPDNPCLSLHIYVASLHWSIMTITSIGYSDLLNMVMLDTCMPISLQHISMEYLREAKYHTKERAVPGGVSWGAPLGFAVSLFHSRISIRASCLRKR